MDFFFFLIDSMNKTLDYSLQVKVFFENNPKKKIINDFIINFLDWSIKILICLIKKINDDYVSNLHAEIYHFPWDFYQFFLLFHSENSCWQICICPRVTHYGKSRQNPVKLINKYFFPLPVTTSRKKSTEPANSSTVLPFHLTASVGTALLSKYTPMAVNFTNFPWISKPLTPDRIKSANPTKTKETKRKCLAPETNLHRRGRGRWWSPAASPTAEIGRSRPELRWLTALETSSGIWLQRNEEEILVEWRRRDSDVI